MQIQLRMLKREGHLDMDNTAHLPRIAEEVVDIAELSPVHVEGTATFADPLVLVEGIVKTTVTYICSRCLREFERVLTTRLTVTYTTDETQADEDIPFVSGDVLDVTPDLEESIFLSIDDRPLCREDCKGLCPECGCNWNEQSCDCDTRTIDPRLAALKDLLSDEQSE